MRSIKLPVAFGRRVSGKQTVPKGGPVRRGGLESVDRDLQALRQALLAVASAQTAYDPTAYAERREVCPLTGHCAAVAYLVQQRLGGEQLSAKVTFRWAGQTLRDTHFWNRLPDGREVDLTGSQFGGDGWRPLADSLGQPSPHPQLQLIGVGPARGVPPRRTVNPRFIALAEAVAAVEAPG
jgi:hypothetical protein